MKKLLSILVASALCFQGQAAELKDLTEATTVAGGDLLLLAIDPSNTNLPRKITFTNLKTALALQPLDSDLTSIAALTTTAFGRSLLTAANLTAAATLLELPKFEEVTPADGYIPVWSAGADNFYESTSPAAFRTHIAAEAAIGNPATTGHVLSSTSAGTRSWVAPAPAVVTLTDGATVQWACDASKSSQNATWTLGGNRTLVINSATSGMTGILIVKQDATGSRTLTLPATSKVISGGGGVIVLTTTASAIDVLSWFYDGVNFFWTTGRNFN